jgi:hypothetical protein
MGLSNADLFRLASDMADRIEALTAKCEALGQEVNMAKYGRPDFAWSIHVEAMADLEAECARLRENLADAALALDAAGMELSDFANCLSREAWAANNAYEAAISARAALNTGEETK